jgi:exosortase/archaeosortase family protein
MPGVFMELLNCKSRILNLNSSLNRRLGNRRFLWLLLASLLFIWNTALLWLSHAPDTYQCINLLLWLGVLIALEDQLPSLWPRPSKFSAFLGGLILTLTVVRGSVVIHQYEKFLSLCLAFIALGLCLLNRPITEWKLFRKPLAIAFLWQAFTPIGIFLGWSLSNILPNLSAFSTWLLLYGLGFKATVSGQKVLMGSGGVDVYPPCAGLEQINFSLFIIIIFLICFPLRKKFNIFWVLALSVPIAISCNVVRLALLAYFTSWANGAGMGLFDFFHESHGSLIFSLISGSFVGYLYLLVLDRELLVK